MKVRKASIKMSPLETGFQIGIYILLSLFTLLCIYPLWYTLANSFANQTDINNGMLLFPLHPSVNTYIELFKKGDIPSAFLVSTLRTVVSTTLCIVFTSMFAYLVTQKEMFARKFVYRFSVITMYASAGLIPWYLVMKAYRFNDSFLLYVVPGIINVFFVILVKTYIESIPASLEESASIDGAGFFTLFFRIIFPLAKPIVATIAVYQAVGAWNTYLDNYLLVNDPGLQTMQMVLFNYLNQAQVLADSMKNASASGAVVSPQTMKSFTPETVRCATTVIAVAPILCVYPFLQKYFVKGIMVGAIKG